MYFDPLEALAARHDNVVLRDRDGNPSVFVRFEKCLSSDLDPSLPAHVHPAFIIDGKERDYILIGKYKAGVVESGKGYFSIPNANPVYNTTHDWFLQQMKIAGPGISGMTVADYGFIKLLAQKNGWRPQGNTNYTASHALSLTAWQVGKNLSAGNFRLYNGWKYECLTAHTSAAENKPDVSPHIWKKLKQVGGTTKDTGSPMDGYLCGRRTLNGSGPKEWYLGGDARNIADIVSSPAEFQFGYRTVDCEIQVLENNDAADPEADLSADSGAWRAILPHAGDDGYDLVKPGTEGTLHWNYVDSTIVLDTHCDDLTSGLQSVAFTALAPRSTLAYVPSIMKELGLFPTGSGDTTPGTLFVNFGSGERIAIRGGMYNYTTTAGMGWVRSSLQRTSVSDRYGARPRMME